MQVEVEHVVKQVINAGVSQVPEICAHAQTRELEQTCSAVNNHSERLSEWLAACEIEIFVVNGVTLMQIDHPISRICDRGATL